MNDSDLDLSEGFRVEVSAKKNKTSTHDNKKMKYIIGGAIGLILLVIIILIITNSKKDKEKEYEAVGYIYCIYNIESTKTDTQIIYE